MNRSHFFIWLLCAGISPGFTAEWVNVSDPVTAVVKPGYAGPTAGVAVDRTLGDVYMVINDQGLWKSSNQGQSFRRVDKMAIGGRCETGYALQLDPNSQRLFCFMIYGSSGYSTNAGLTWSKSKLSHFDFGAVDWEDTTKRVLALRHESGGKLATSDNGGETWKDLEDGFSGLGVFDSKTFVATKAKEKGIFRSTDAGLTWSKAADTTPAGVVPVVFKGVGYWPAGNQLLVSRDKGASWTTFGEPVEAVFGPFFGRDENNLVVVGKSGFQESTDGGKTWKMAAPLPAGFSTGRVGPNYAWDPVHNLFYASTMTKPTFKYQR